MYILVYLRKHFFYNINTLQIKSLGSVKVFFFLKKCLMLIKAVAYLIKKNLLWNIIAI